MIFDTSIWVGLASGQMPSQAVLKAAGDEQVYISAISLGELSFGVESCSDPATRMLRIRYLAQLGTAARSRCFFPYGLRLRHPGRLHETVGPVAENTGQRYLDSCSGNGK
jgi:uncharacterized protein with PIN domain